MSLYLSGFSLNPTNRMSNAFAAWQWRVPSFKCPLDGSISSPNLGRVFPGAFWHAFSGWEYEAQGEKNVMIKYEI